jgi:hypothetical protein
VGTDQNLHNFDNTRFVSSSSGRRKHGYSSGGSSDSRVSVFRNSIPEYDCRRFPAKSCSPTISSAKTCVWLLSSIHRRYPKVPQIPVNHLPIGAPVSRSITHARTLGPNTNVLELDIAVCDPTTVQPHDRPASVQQKDCCRGRRQTSALWIDKVAWIWATEGISQEDQRIRSRQAVVNRGCKSFALRKA